MSRTFRKIPKYWIEYRSTSYSDLKTRYKDRDDDLYIPRIRHYSTRYPYVVDSWGDELVKSAYYERWNRYYV